MRTVNLGALVVAVVTACGLLAAPSAANAAPDSYLDPLADAAPTPQLNWTDCSDGFQCATADVPLDYTQPHGKTIDLAVIKLPATDPANRIGTLFVNFGGPGRSGVERLRERGRWSWLFSDELRSRFDLVSWDPRGVFNSTAVHCFATSAEQEAYFADFPEMPGDAQGEAPFYAASKDFAQRCEQQAGDLLPHMSTVDTARDLDLLRRAVGDSKLTYHGISYGTHLGAIYANLFPSRVRAIAMDGTMDFQGSATGHGDDGTTKPVDTRQDVATGIAQTFESFLNQCAAAGSRCAFSGGDVHAKWTTLMQRVKEHPITITGADGTATTYSYSAVINTAGDLSNPSGWPDIATTLQQLYDASGTTVSVSAAAKSSEYVDNGTEAFNAIQCADSWVPTDEAVYSRLAVSEDQRVPYFGRIGVFDMMSCAYWPAEAVHPYTGPWNRKTASPLLVINSRFDPSTPLAGAVDGMQELANARMLVVEGSGHSTMYVHSSCAEKAKRDYLISGVLPSNGSVCGIDAGPFDL